MNLNSINIKGALVKIKWDDVCKEFSTKFGLRLVLNKFWQTVKK
jgi:hypothetical protein